MISANIGIFSSKQKKRYRIRKHARLEKKLKIAKNIRLILSYLLRAREEKTKQILKLVACVVQVFGKNKFRWSSLVINSIVFVKHKCPKQ